MDPVNTTVAARFAAFQAEQDPIRVQEALDTILAAERDVPVADSAARNTSATRWLRFFAALDAAIDPHWDPQDMPVKGAPLPASHGAVYPSGEVDPASIPDPAERARYELALHAAKDHYKRYSVQWQLRQLDEQAMTFAGLLVRTIAAGSVADRERFERQLAASATNAERKQRLRSLLAGAPENGPR